MALSKECFTRIVNLLTPYMVDEGMRQAILQPALYGTALLNQIVFTGNANTFTVMLVRSLDTFGRLSEEKSAVVAVLQALQAQVGWDQQEEIKDLINCAEGGSNLVSTSAETIPDLPKATNNELREHIFISYSSADRVSFVDRLARDLSSAGYRIWVDNLDEKYGGIIGGKSWQQELADALNHAKVVVFVITPDSIRSKWVRAELKRAGEIGRTVLGVVARPLKTPEELWLLGAIKVGDQALKDLHYRDFTEIGYGQGLKVLLNDLARLA